MCSSIPHRHTIQTIYEFEHWALSLLSVFCTICLQTADEAVFVMSNPYQVSKLILKTCLLTTWIKSLRCLSPLWADETKLQGIICSQKTRQTAHFKDFSLWKTIGNILSVHAKHKTLLPYVHSTSYGVLGAERQSAGRKCHIGLLGQWDHMLGPQGVDTWSQIALSPCILTLSSCWQDKLYTS